MLQKLVDFVERLSLDEKMFWRVPKLKSTQAIDLVYERQAKPAAWKVRLGEGREFLPVRGTDLVALLKAAGADLAHIERQMGVSLLTQAVFADLYLERARQLFGEEMVASSIKDARAFFNEVGEKAQRIAQSEVPAAAAGAAAAEPPRAKLKLVQAKSDMH